MSGSSRSRIAPAAIFSIRCVAVRVLCSAGSALPRARLRLGARLSPCVLAERGQSARVHDGYRIRCGRLPRIGAPGRRRCARAAAARARPFAPCSQIADLPDRNSRARPRHLLVQQRELVDALHRLADRRIEAQQDALQHRGRHVQRHGRHHDRLAATGRRSAGAPARARSASVRSSSRANTLAVAAERCGFQPTGSTRCAIAGAIGAAGRKRRIGQIEQDQPALFGARGKEQLAQLSARRHCCWTAARRPGCGLPRSPAASGLAGLRHSWRLGRLRQCGRAAAAAAPPPARSDSPRSLPRRSRGSRIDQVDQAQRQLGEVLLFLAECDGFCT